MTEYRTLKMALKAMRENFMNGDLSGFGSRDELVDAIRATERRTFEIVRAA